MALNINGTTGISGVDGSASAASIAGTDANTGLSFASDTVNINTGGTTKATVDSNGRLGVGTTSPARALHINSGSENNAVRFESTDTEVAIELKDTTGTSEIQCRNDFRLKSNSSEHLRIESSGRVLIGTTTENFAKVCLKVNAANDQPFSINDSGNNSSLTSRIGFRTGNTQVGTIKSNQSSTQYNTSSDYRLKENAVAISDGITRIKTLKPYKFNWIIDETDTVIDGFFAHEVSNVVPEAISGTKDQIADSADVARGDAMKVGDPVYQQIDQSKLVPLLTAALQEAVAKIEILETKVAALEAA
jgi:hypothetical protein